MDKVIVLVLAIITGASCKSNLNYCKKDGHFEVMMRPPPVVEVNIGDRVSLVCAAHGHNTTDPLVYWVKSVGPYFDEKGKNIGPVHVGKSVLFFDSVTEEDIDTYKCVVESCCGGESEDINVDIKVPDATCEDEYGIGHLVFSAVWEFKLFSEAVKYCADLGLELALPRSEEENQQFLSDVQKSFEYHPNAEKYSQENWLWIAGSDAAEEGRFMDLIKNQDLIYKNFQSKQPDNWDDGGKYPDGQDCVGFSRVTGGWDDSFSHYRRPFACLCPQS